MTVHVHAPSQPLAPAERTRLGRRAQLGAEQRPAHGQADGCCGSGGCSDGCCGPTEDTAGAGTPADTPAVAPAAGTRLLPIEDLGKDKKA